MKIYVQKSRGQAFYAKQTAQTLSQPTKQPTPSVPIWPLANEDLAVFTLDRLFSGT